MQSGHQMTEITLEPDLSTCIRTLAGKQHERIVRQLLTAGVEDPELEKKAEMLRMFLESTDFRRLRREYEPHLVQGKRVTFTLCLMTNETEYFLKISDKPNG